MTLLQEEKTSLLHGAEGDLVLVRITADARQLEEVLEIVAELPFPINPEIRHGAAGASLVEFPAYSTRVDEVREALAARGPFRVSISVQSVGEGSAE